MQALNNAKSDLRADKSQLQNAYNKLTEQVSTNGKTPSSIKNMKQRVKRLKLNIMRLNEAERVLRNNNPSVNEVTQTLEK